MRWRGRRAWWDFLTLEGWLWVGFVAYVIGFLVVALMALHASPCQGAWCPDFICQSSRICGRCVCVSRDLSGGFCADIDQARRLEAEGYREIP